MLLVTGGTGFIGRRVLKRLSETDSAVRTLLRPSAVSPNLPRGVAFNVALSSLLDKRGVRAAMIGVDAIIHLAGAEQGGHPVGQLDAEIEGTRVLAEAAADAGVKRILFLSHLGASPTSAYLLQRSKAYAEEHIRRSGVPYTIIRTGIVFGRDDHFTTSLAMMLSALPFIFPLPGEGETLLQPLWVEDLATALLWTIDDPATKGQIYEIGGPEYLCGEHHARTWHSTTTAIPPATLLTGWRVAIGTILKNSASFKFLDGLSCRQSHCRCANSARGLGH